VRLVQKRQIIREQIIRKINRKDFWKVVGGDMFNVRKNPSVKKNVGIGP